MRYLKSISIVLCLVLVGLMTACKNNTDQSQPTEKATQATTVSVSDTIHITLKANDNMHYDKTQLTAHAGQVVVLTLVHPGSMPVGTMGHNFVLLAQGVTPANFAQKAWKAKDNDYIPKNADKYIIAHTKLIGGGQSTSITFTAPQKGSYDYLCTFPGHYANMHGKFIIE